MFPKTKYTYASFAIIYCHGSQMETTQPQTSKVCHSNAFVKLDRSASARYFAAYLHAGSRGQTGHDGIDHLALGGKVTCFLCISIIYGIL